ncbi:ligand-binding sensor domain-containing protein [Flavitalea sp.]|nr:two-component regulator propeller domain-containing protein [Flavitalea sp.]
MKQHYLASVHLIFCLAISFTIPAQTLQYYSEKLTIDEGLSSNKVNDIAQDDYGFLWIATSDGLNRFDGTEVVKYYHQANNNSIPHNYVYCLKMLPGNNLAIGTQAGLCFYNGAKGTFKDFYYRLNNSLDEYNNAIVGIETDSKKNCWAYSRNCIFIFDSSLNLKKVISSPYDEPGITKKRLRYIEKIYPLSDGNVLLYLDDGYKIYNAQTETISTIENSSYHQKLSFLKNNCSSPDRKPDQYFPSSNIFKVYDKYFLSVVQCMDSLFLFDEQGLKVSSCFFPFNKYPYILWSQRVSTMDSANLLFSFHNYGVAIIPVSWDNGKPAIHFPSSLLFESKEFGSGFRDRQANWWLATIEDGIQKISPQKQHFKSIHLVNSSGEPIKYEVASFTREKNTLWVSVYGEGFFEIDLKTGRQQQHNLALTMKNNWADFTWNIRQVSDDTIWIGTQAGMFWYQLSTKKAGRIRAFQGKPSIIDSVAITMQFEDSHGMVWMGLGKANGICNYNYNQKQFNYYPSNTAGGYPLRYAISADEDKKGNLWFVSDASTSLVRWDRYHDRFQTIPLPFRFRQHVAGLTSICYESDSILWLGTLTGGLLKYNPLNKSILVYGHDRGLINSHIISIHKDKSNRLWLSTDVGLSCFDPRTEIFTNFTTKEGLPANYISGAFYYDSDQQYLFNGSKGLIFHFDPDNLDLQLHPQKTMITAINVNGKYSYSLVNKTNFNSRQNDITIHYTNIDLLNGASTNYAYQLLNKNKSNEDSDWIMAGHQRQINFSRLAPGDYIFNVCVSINNKIQVDKSASFSFSIRPHFTQTSWFYALLMLTLAIVFYCMYRYHLTQLKRTEQVRSEISRNLHDEVGSTLTNISLGSLLAQKQLIPDSPVNRILDRIYQDSQSVSQTMRDIVWSINPRVDTLSEALPRMLHYASELLEAKNIELEAEIAPGIEQVKLSMYKRRDLYLIFKEAVNNLAKHSNAHHVKVSIQLVRHTITMTISDNGTGFYMPVVPDGNGLKNMQERARNHHWQLRIESIPDKGTVITLKAQIA